jgi:hypothetical protein
MSATMTSQKTSKSPCGCGCSGGKTPPSCSCGCPECATCQDMGYTRPLFFAGQLLTEDDLQQFTDYVVAKNRLHTRYLAGTGVVCGLQVTCEPCGGGKVIVNPGYALDCCGNDIVLSCSQTLDINKMVRDLKLKLRGGYDCGDPCAGSETGSQSGGTTSSEYQANRGGAATSKPTLEPPPPKPTIPAHKYCLYVKYCELPSDPVSPYATDAPCGPTTTCLPTRCREGFTFELRCPAPCEAESPICCNIWSCIGDRTAREKTVKDSGFLSVYGGRILEAWERLHNDPALPIEDIPAYLQRVQHHTGTLNEALAALESSESKEKVKESVLWSFVNAVSSLSSDLALFWVQPHDKRVQIERQAHKDDKDSVNTAEKALAVASKEYLEERFFVAEGIPSALERAYVATLFSLVRELVSFSDEASKRKAGAPVQLTQTSLRFLAAGAVFGPRFRSEATSSLEAQRDWLIYHLERSPQTCCDLLREVCAVTLPAPGTPEQSTAADARLLGEASQILTRAVKDVLRGCICNALNPPCPSCDDTGVLLACLTVEDCRVKDICNAVREFVLTPVNLRYWIPEIGRIGKEIAEWCCECGCEKDEPRKPDRDDWGGLGVGPAPPYVRMLLRMLAEECPEPGKPKDERSRHRLSQWIETWHASVTGPATGVSLAAGARAIQEVVPAATATLEEELRAALRDLESMRDEHKKLLDRVARLEKPRQQKAQPEA